MRSLSVEGAARGGAAPLNSLGGLVRSPGASACLLVAVCLNVLLLLYSHWGVSGVVDSNLGWFGGGGLDGDGGSGGGAGGGGAGGTSRAAGRALGHAGSMVSGAVDSNILGVLGAGGASRAPSGRALGDASMNLCRNKPRDEALWKGLTLTETVELLLECNLRGKQPCFGKSSCVAECVRDRKGFSPPCANCFGQVSACTRDKCVVVGGSCVKADDPDCHRCLRDKCALSFMSCAGLRLPLDGLGDDDAAGDQGGSDEVLPPAHLNVGSCAQLRTLYEVQFVDAVSKAWHGGAAWLAVVLFLASGVWPYLKNVLVLLVWFRPMRPATRGRLLLAMGRLGRWSYVDVFVMVLLNATLRIEKNLSTRLQFVVLSHPRAGVFCFALAATASLLQSEWLRLQHEEYVAVELERERLSNGVARHGNGGRLRSHWRQTVAHNLAESEHLHRRASVSARLLLPASCVAAIVVGCYALTAIEFELGGTMALLPGENRYSYSVDQVMRSIISEGWCADDGGSEVGRGLLFALFFLTVLVLPTVVCIAVALLWVVRSRAAALEAWMARPGCGSGSMTVGGGPAVSGVRRPTTGGGKRLEVTVDMCSAFACLDVFGVSLLLVSFEIDKVVRAVGDAAHVGGVNVDMLSRVRAGGIVLGLAIVLYWLTLLLNAAEAKGPVYAPWGSAAAAAAGGGYLWSTGAPAISSAASAISEEDEIGMYEDVHMEEASSLVIDADHDDRVAHI